jgi:hypothetical protein
MQLGEAGDQGQPDANARGVLDDLAPLPERLEDAFAEVERDARACILDPSNTASP